MVDYVASHLSDLGITRGSVLMAKTFEEYEYTIGYLSVTIWIKRTRSDTNVIINDIADKLSDKLEDDPQMRQKIVEHAIASPDFKKRVVRKLVEDLS